MIKFKYTLTTLAILGAAHWVNTNAYSLSDKDRIESDNTRPSVAAPLITKGLPPKLEIYQVGLAGHDTYQKNEFIYLGGISKDHAIQSPSNCADKPASKLVVNVKDKGAKGDGRTDDTVAIQSAIEQVSGTGGTVLVPDGVYMIDAVTHLLLKNKMTFKLSKAATLKAIPNNKDNSGIIRIEQVSDVIVTGGTLEGERKQHQGTTGEWGMGLEIYGAKNVVVEDVIAKDNWGDGFYIDDSSVNIVFCSVTADNNRRQGMSIISVEGLRVMDSVFKNTHGTLPMAGIDIEPDEGDIVKNIQILNSQFLNNSGSGIEATVRNELAGSAFVKNLIIDSNTVTNNGVVGTYSAGIKISRLSGQKITNNIVKNNAHDGIIIVSGSEENIVSGNTISGNGNKTDKNIGFGIVLYDKADRNTIINNKISENINRDVYDDCSGNTIRN